MFCSIQNIPVYCMTAIKSHCKMPEPIAGTDCMRAEFTLAWEA